MSITWLWSLPCPREKVGFSDVGDLCLTPLSPQDHVQCISMQLDWGESPLGLWSWLSAVGSKRQLLPISWVGVLLARWQGPRACYHHPLQKRWELGPSRVHILSPEPEIPFIFFGEVSFTRQLVIP